MERHKGNLKSDAGYDKRKRHINQHRAFGKRCRQGDVLEIKRPREAVNKRNAQQINRGREYRCEQIFHSRLVRFVLLLVESSQCRQRQRGRFQSDDKYQEMTGRNHQIHAKERHQKQLDEFAATHKLALAIVPFDGLQQYEEKPYVQYILYRSDNRRCGIHAGKRLSYCHRRKKAIERI